MLINLRANFFLGLTAFLLNGCWGGKLALQQNCSVEASEAISAINIQDITDKLAFEICGTVEENLSYFRPDEIVIVPDFVDINSLRPEGHGLIIGEKFRVSVNKICKVPIRQVELNRDFRLNTDGLTALTRDAQAIRNSKPVVKTALVGTYSIQYNKLNLVAKKISIDNSVITDASSKEIKWRCEITSDNKEIITWVIK